MAWLEPVTLRGSRATLVPLDPSHHDGLVEAVNDGEVWKLWYTRIPAPAAMGAEIERRLAEQKAGTMLPFVVLDTLSGKIAGMTTFMHVDAANRRVEIGATWYRKSVQRTSLNTECKLALLTHAFETLGCIAVEFHHRQRVARGSQPSALAARAAASGLCSIGARRRPNVARA